MIDINYAQPDQSWRAKGFRRPADSQFSGISSEAGSENSVQNWLIFQIVNAEICVHGHRQHHEN